MTPARDLLLRIARCPVVEECLVGDAGGHPCTRVVLEQWPGATVEERRARWHEQHHVPEPWAGHLGVAPLLFLGSSPALWAERADGPRAAQAPRPAWQDGEVADRFEGTFDHTAPDGVHRVAADGAPPKAVPAWRTVNKLARLLHDRDVVAGRDYALADVVHCRSRDEQAVREALAECVPRYLSPVLAASPAAVVVVLGTEARDAIRAGYGYHDPTIVSRPLAIEGKVRRVVLLAHPSTRGKSRYPRVLAGDDLATVRAVLAEATAASP